jgi:hypothetical protein
LGDEEEETGKGDGEGARAGSPTSSSREGWLEGCEGEGEGEETGKVEEGKEEDEGRK